jgi:hypothetical protein
VTIVRTFICAEGIVQDLATRRLSVFNIVEHLTAVSFPVLFPRLSLCAITKWDGEGEKKASGTLQVFNNDTKLLESPYSLDFMSSPHHRVMWEFQGFVMPSPGVLRFSMMDGELELARYEVTAELVKPPTVTQVGGARRDSAPSEGKTIDSQTPSAEDAPAEATLGK